MRSRSLRVAVAVAALALVAPVAARAAPRWSAPFTVAGQANGAPGVAVDGHGGALFSSWDVDGVFARSRSASGVLSPLTTLIAPVATRFYTDPEAVLNAGGSGMIVWTQRDARTPVLSSQIRTYAARRSAALALSAAQRVEPTASERAGDPHVAIDPRGRAYVTYDDFGDDVSRALATSAQPGKPFAIPTPLFNSPDTGERPDVALGPGTQVSVTIVHQRLTPRSDGTTQIQGDLQVLSGGSGTTFGKLTNVVHADRQDRVARSAFGPPAIATGADGVTAVAWTQPRGGACLKGICHDLYAATRPAGARSFGAPVRLESAGGYQGEQPAVVVDQGQAIVAWHERVGNTTDVVAATLGADGVPTPSAVLGVDLLRSLDLRPALAVDGLGSVIAAWISPNASGTAGTPFFSIRPRLLPFSRPVPVKRARAAKDIAVAAGADGHAALAWLEDRGGAKPFTNAAVVAQVRTP
jgi:hypothetical protein